MQQKNTLKECKEDKEKKNKFGSRDILEPITDGEKEISDKLDKAIESIPEGEIIVKYNSATLVKAKPFNKVFGNNVDDIENLLEAEDDNVVMSETHWHKRGNTNFTAWHIINNTGLASWYGSKNDKFTPDYRYETKKEASEVAKKYKADVAEEPYGSGYNIVFSERKKAIQFILDRTKNTTTGPNSATTRPKLTNSPEYQQLLKDREAQEAKVKSTKDIVTGKQIGRASCRERVLRLV